MDSWGSGLNSSDLLEGLSDLNKSLKSNEEIEKYSLDSGLKDDERFKLLMQSKSHYLQKISGAKSLPSLVRENGGSFLERVLPLIQNAVDNSDPKGDVHIALAEAFTQIATDSSVSSSVVCDGMLPIALEMLDAPSEDVICYWLDAVFAMIPLLTTPAKLHVMELAVSKSDMTQTVPSRLVACQLFGALAPTLDADLIRTGFLNHAYALCQDTDYDVRVRMCEQLEVIARQLGPDAAGTEILDEIKTLARDEEDVVRYAAVHAVAMLVDFFPAKVRGSDVVDLVIEVFETAKRDLRVYVAELFGKLYYALRGVLTDESLDKFMVFYGGLVTDRDLECQRCAAYNLPGVVLGMGEDAYLETLSALHGKLVRSDCPIVRHTAAKSIHEIMRILSPETNQLLCKDMVVRLLSDDVPAVVAALSKNLDSCLARLNSDDRETRVATFTPMVAGIKKAFEQARPNWRSLLTVLSQMDNFALYFTSDQVYNEFVPQLFELMVSNAANPVKERAAVVVCHYIKRLPKATYRYELCNRLICDLCKGPSYWHRMLFLRVCEEAVVMFSRSFFKKFFFEAFLETALDAVSNVRLRATSLLPPCKRMLRLPLDSHLLLKFDDVLSSLEGDSNADVAEAAAQAASVCNGIVLIPSTRGLSPQFEDDLIDMKKEEEEAALVKLEEEERESERRREEFVRDGRRGKGLSASAEESGSASRRSKTTRVRTVSNTRGSAAPAGTRVLSGERKRGSGSTSAPGDGDGGSGPRLRRSNSVTTSSSSGSKRGSGSTRGVRTVGTKSISSTDPPPRKVNSKYAHIKPRTDTGKSRTSLKRNSSAGSLRTGSTAGSSGSNGSSGSSLSRASERERERERERGSGSRPAAAAGSSGGSGTSSMSSRTRPPLSRRSATTTTAGGSSGGSSYRRR